MFEHITITRQSPTGSPIDLGSLAECLLFYEKVRLICDLDTFKYLMRCCGPENLLRLCELGTLEIEFFENITAVAAIQTTHGELYELKTLQTKTLKYHRASRKFFDEWAGPSGKGANKLFRGFDKRIIRSVYDAEILESAHQDILDASYLRNAVASILAALAPEYVVPNPLVFAIKPVQQVGSYFLDTNIDFAQANDSFQRHVPTGFGNLTPSYLLLHVAETRRDIAVGSRLDSDFVLSPMRAAVAACKFARLMAGAGMGIKAADTFQEEVVDGVTRIRDVVNSGQRTFDEVADLVEGAAKFKQWVVGKENSEQLRRDYLREVSRTDWAEKLPPRIVRMLVMAGLGVAASHVTHDLISDVCAFGLNAADYFLLDRLIKGWRPSQFIEGPLKEFLSAD